MTIYGGKDFSPADIQTIRDLIEQDPKLLRSPLSRRLCELFGWFKPNGELKDMTCRVTLLRMHEQGLNTLPASRIPVARRRPDFPATPASDAQADVQARERNHALEPRNRSWARPSGPCWAVLGRVGARWQGATTLRAHAHEEEQRRQRAPARLNRVRSAVTQAVKVVVGTKARIHAACPAARSGQLRFLGSSLACRIRTSVQARPGASLRL